jgi:serine/threonine protein kinase
MRKSVQGSVNYLSPEQMSHQYYNRKIDLWSLGVVAFELLFGYSPFEQEIFQSLVDQNHGIVYELKFPDEISASDEAKDFIMNLLEKNPGKRMEIDKALKHPFLQKVIKDF